MQHKILRIGIIGTESSGKSTLAAALAEHFGEPWAAEYVREFWDRRQGRIDAVDLPTIARGQIANEEAAANKAQRVVFCDTTLLMNVRWADDLYGGRIPAWVREEADRRSLHYASHLYCEADLPWQPDPQRTFADAATWRASAERCEGMLIDRELPYVAISGSGPERVANAVRAVESILESIDGP